jgi:hypothetical protein
MTTEAILLTFVVGPASALVLSWLLNGEKDDG